MFAGVRMAYTGIGDLVASLFQVTPPPHEPKEIVDRCAALDALVQPTEELTDLYHSQDFFLMRTYLEGHIDLYVEDMLEDGGTGATYFVKKKVGRRTTISPVGNGSQSAHVIGRKSGKRKKIDEKEADARLYITFEDKNIDICKSSNIGSIADELVKKTDDSLPTYWLNYVGSTNCLEVSIIYGGKIHKRGKLPLGDGNVGETYQECLQRNIL